MRLPIQQWLPELAPNLALPEVQRDRQRAMSEWRGESVVWLLPELERTVRWVENPQSRYLALPSEHLDKIEVHHIGANGRAFGPGSDSRFPNGRIDTLLAKWLNLERLGPIDLSHVPEVVSMTPPRFDKDKFMGYEERSVRLAPLYTYPIAPRDDGIPGFTIGPSGAESRKSVSPDTETIESPYGGQRKLEHDENGFPTYVNDRAPGMRTFVTILKWPPPFRNLMPVCSGFDEVGVQQNMAAIAAASSSHPERALSDALSGAAQLVWRASATTQAAELGPILAEEGEAGLLMALEARHGISASSFEDLAKKVDWKEFMGRQVQVRGAWGPVGLLWALLIDELESHNTFGTCENCGRVIPKPRVNKRFCSRDDDAACYKLRNTMSQRASRQRARTRSRTRNGAPPNSKC